MYCPFKQSLFVRLKHSYNTECLKMWRRLYNLFFNGACFASRGHFDISYLHRFVIVVYVRLCNNTIKKTVAKFLMNHEGDSICNLFLWKNFARLFLRICTLLNTFLTPWDFCMNHLGASLMGVGTVSVYLHPLQRLLLVLRSSVLRSKLLSRRCYRRIRSLSAATWRGDFVPRAAPAATPIGHSVRQRQVSLCYSLSQSFQVEGTQNREIARFFESTIGTFFTGSFKAEKQSATAGKNSPQQLLSCDFYQ